MTRPPTRDGMSASARLWWLLGHAGLKVIVDYARRVHGFDDEQPVTVLNWSEWNDRKPIRIEYRNRPYAISLEAVEALLDQHNPNWCWYTRPAPETPERDTMDHWSKDTIATLERLSVELRSNTRDQLFENAALLDRIAKYIGENVAIEMNGNWTYWGSQGPCPVTNGTLVDVCLLNGHVYLNQEACNRDFPSRAAGKAWTARSGTGIKAYRLSKGTAQ